MDLKSNKSGGAKRPGLVKQRNKAHDQLMFNEKFPTVVADLIDEKHKKKKHQLDIASRKRI
ncbi:MAG: hypothetical protein FWC72_05805, partial [Oscillospiraceae bacterium]|nr:hypothetical protein [Oscillospiraceae bacterium]